MSDFYLDTETFSLVDIKNGLDRYSKAAEVMIWTYASGREGLVRDYDVTTGARMPSELEDNLLDERVTLIAHNAQFDREVIANNGFPTDIDRWHCTMAQALAHSLPGALDKLCAILKVDDDLAKLKDGKALVRLFCMPRPKNMKLRRATRETHPEEWKRFVEYARNDISSMREVHRIMPAWNYGTGSEAARREKDLWHLDQRINQRGVCIDTDLVEGAIISAGRVQAQLAADTFEMTEGALTSTTKRDALLTLLRDVYDVEIENLRGSTIEALLKTEHDLPPVVVELLENRLAASSTSVSKYKRFKQLTGADGRLRNTLQFCGAARTGRWAGRGVQLQNLPRPTLKQKAIDAGIDAIKGDYLDLVDDNPMTTLSSAIRGCVVAPEGRKLVVADLSNIEGRMLAWLAGEEWKLQAFRDFDTCMGTDGQWHTGDELRDAVLAGRPIDLVLDKKGEPTRKGHDLYALAYARAFGITPEEVMENKRTGDGSYRQGGKILELACFGPDTQVVTNNGIKRIVAVLDSDKLWDGVEWVSHKGLVARSVRRVVSVAGIRVTPDHRILTGSFWIPASQLASSESILSLALATGSENLPWSASNGGNTGLFGSTTSSFNAPAVPNPISCISATCAEVNRRAATSAPKNKPGTTERISPAMRTLFPTTKSAARCLTEFRPASTVATILTMLATRITAAVASTFTNLGAKIAVPFSPTLSPSTVGITTTSNWIGRTSTVGTNLATSGSLPNERTKETVAKSGQCNNESPTLNEKIQTYDIAYSGPRNRFTVLSDRGPLIVHNCGYQGSVGAFATFAVAYGTDLDDMALKAAPSIPAAIMEKADRSYAWAIKNRRDYNMVPLTYKVCWSFVRLWRDANPKIEAFWAELEKAFRSAINAPGKMFTAGKVSVIKSGAWVRVLLPSGRSLCYPAPRLDENDKLSYMGLSQLSRQWRRLMTYGGKVVENVTQAAARDVIADAIPTIDRSGYSVCVTVHDEDICEAPDNDRYTSDHLAALMACNPGWAAGLPLAAAGFETGRYRKD